MPYLPNDQVNVAVLANYLASPTLAWTDGCLRPAQANPTVAAQLAAAITYWTAIATSVGLVTAAPIAPVPTTIASGGTVANGTYTVAVSYATPNGETPASPTGQVVTTGTGISTITVPSPSASTGATGWYAYVSQVGLLVLTRQQAAGAPTAIGTGLTLTAPPTSSGLNPQLTNTTAALLSLLQGAAVIDALAHLTRLQTYNLTPNVSPYEPVR